MKIVLKKMSEGENMRTFSIIFLILLFSGKLYSIDKMIDSLSIRLLISSYIGTEYHPHRENLKGVTISRNDYLLSVKGSIRNHELEAALDNYEEGFAENIKIRKLSFSRQRGLFTIGYLYDKIGHGNRSYIFSKDLLSSYYDVYLTDSHQMNGGLFKYKKNDSAFTVKLGGNPYNTKIADVSYSRKWNSGDVSLFYQHVGYDNYFNTNVNLIGIDFYHCFDYFTLYQFSCYKRLKDNHFVDEKDIIINLSELEIPISENYKLSLNSLYKNYNTIDNYTLINSLEADVFYNKIDISGGLILTSYKVSFIKQYYFMPGYRISESFLLKGYFRFNDTKVGDDYYDFGSQIIINFNY